MLEDRNYTMISLWEIYSIFMQISSIVLVLQDGRRVHTLYVSPGTYKRALFAECGIKLPVAYSSAAYKISRQLTLGIWVNWTV